MNIEKAIARAASKQADKDSKALPKARIRREISLTESKMVYRPVGYHKYYCFHNKGYHEVCTKCRRTSGEAKRNLSDL